MTNHTIAEPMTLRELRQQLSTLTEEQLDSHMIVEDWDTKDQYCAVLAFNDEDHPRGEQVVINFTQELKI